MALLFALGAAVTYGAADFVGGLVTKRTGAVRVVLLSQAVGTSLTAASLPLFAGGVFSRAALGWGFAAGLAGGAGVVLLYRGLAIGRMSMVAPITGVEAAGVPVIAGLLLLGERPSAVALAGVLLALVAVVVVSGATEEGAKGNSRVGLLEAIGAGIAFGVFFICLDQAPDTSGIWPLLSGRAASLLLVAAVALGTRVSPKPPAGTMGQIAAAGLLDVSANILYLLATRQGLLSLTAVLTSMYPGATVLLARVLLKERLLPMQVVGLAIAVAAVILIGLG